MSAFADAAPVPRMRGAVTPDTAARSNARQREWSKKLKEGELLESQDGRLPTDKVGQFPLDRMMKARWWESNSEMDEYVADLQKLNSESEGAGLGLKMMPTDKLIAYQREKRNQHEEILKLTLGEKMIDKKNPATQEHAFRILPALNEKPREQLKADIGKQLIMWELCFTGRIDDMEDLDFVFAVLCDEVILPTTAIWDPAGLTGFSGSLQGVAAGLLKKPKDSPLSYIWAPYDYARGRKGAANKDTVKQNDMAVKIFICQRVFPGFRDYKADELVVWINNIMARRRQLAAGKYDDADSIQDKSTPWFDRGAGTANHTAGVLATARFTDPAAWLTS